MSDITIVMYHYVRKIEKSKYPKIKGLEFSSFCRQLDYLNDNYKIIKVEEIINCLKTGEKLPPKSCWLTFDDGYKDHFSFVLPELLNRKLQGSFFPPVKPITEKKIIDVNKIHFILACAGDFKILCSDLNSLCAEHGIDHRDLSLYKTKHAIPSRYDTAEVQYIKRMLQYVLPQDIRNAIVSRLFKMYVKREEEDFADELYLSLNEAKTLVESGMYVGSHGYSHMWLDKENVKSQLFEIDSSLKFLKDIGSNTENWIMCYPYGAYNKDTLRILKDRNCVLGLTTKVGVAKISLNCALELPRFDTNDFPQ